MRSSTHPKSQPRQAKTRNSRPGPEGHGSSRHAMSGHRGTPTLCVLVITTGPSRKPDSSTQVVPVSTPATAVWRLENHAAKTGSFESLPRGNTAVTPVRTGPTPTFNDPSRQR